MQTYRIGITDGETTTTLAWTVPADAVEDYRASAQGVIRETPGDGRWVIVTPER